MTDQHRLTATIREMTEGEIESLGELLDMNGGPPPKMGSRWARIWKGNVPRAAQALLTSTAGIGLILASRLTRARSLRWASVGLGTALVGTTLTSLLMDVRSRSRGR